MSRFVKILHNGKRGQIWAKGQKGKSLNSVQDLIFKLRKKLRTSLDLYYIVLLFQGQKWRTLARKRSSMAKKVTKNALFLKKNPWNFQFFGLQTPQNVRAVDGFLTQETLRFQTPVRQKKKKKGGEIFTLQTSDENRPKLMQFWGLNCKITKNLHDRSFHLTPLESLQLLMGPSQRSSKFFEPKIEKSQNFSPPLGKWSNQQEIDL